jgi:HEAT repeat protein
MKIYFCDLCNESIRQEDLEKSRITTSRGKMICAKCLPSTSGSGAAPPAGSSPTRAGGSGGVLALALVAAVTGGVGLWQSLMATDRLAARPDPAPRLAGVESDIDDLRTDGVSIRGRLDTLATRIERLAGEPSALREAMGEQIHRLEALERSTQELAKLLSTLRSDREVLQRLELVQARIDGDLSALRGQLQGLTARIGAAGTAATPADAPAGVASETSSAPPAADAAPGFDAETRRLIGELSSKDEGVRWTAADRLANKKDRALIASLLPLLADKDTFVKYRVITAMRDLDAKQAIEPLLKLLRDEQQIVRGEAQDALVVLTGHGQRQNVEEGSSAEREKGVKAWEEWWAKNKSRFESTASS